MFHKKNSALSPTYGYESQGFSDPEVRVAFDELIRIRKKKHLDKINDPVFQKTISVKREITDARRKEFNSRKNRFILQLIASGKKYICAFDGCGHKEELEIDHIIPLSKGGSDEVSNLQFLCKFHNGSKGDR